MIEVKDIKDFPDTYIMYVGEIPDADEVYAYTDALGIRIYGVATEQY